jgi:peptidyl-prolyl cis-trans isomerase SurA
MKFSKISFLMIFSIMFILMGNLPVSAEICNRIVAAVNNEIITLYELNGKIKELTGADPYDLERQDKAGFIEARRNVLNLLVDEKVSHDKAMELGIEISSKEVDATLEQIKARNNWTQEEMIAGLKKQGINYEQYRNNLKKEMEQMRLVDFEVKSKIIIRDETIKKYYDDHIDEFTSEDKIRLAIILLIKDNSTPQNEGLTLSQEAEQLVSRLENGEDFAVLALKFSKGPGAEDGGDIGFIQTSQLDPSLKRIIDIMKVGDISRPMITPAGIQIIKLLEKQEKGVKTLEEVRGHIYDVLYSEEINKRFTVWIKELRETAFIKVIF